MSKQECILFGAAQSGLRAMEILSDQYKIVAFADNDSKKWGTEINGIFVIPYSELKKNKDILIIVSSVYYRSISRQLAKDGFYNIKIFYLIGDFGGNGEIHYVLFDYSDKELFSECYRNGVFSSALQKDIALNYPGIKKRKVILFCAYIFPPLGGPGVQRSLKFVKYLRDYGYEPVVLTVGKNDRHIPIDESFLDEIPSGIQIIRVDEVFPTDVLTVEAQQEILNLYYGVTGNDKWVDEFLEFYMSSKGARLLPDDKITWVNECLKVIIELINLNDIYAVYTTGYPFSSFFLGYFMKSSYGIPWVADYRDPWAANENYWNERYYQYIDSKKIMQEIEEKCIDQMNHIIVCSPPMKPEMQELYKINPSKISVITNGFDEEDFKFLQPERKKNTKFTLCHNGNISNYVEATMIIIIINELIQKGRIDADKIEYVINGDVQSEQLRKMKNADMYSVLRFNGRLPHIESLKIASDSDLLVLHGSYGEGSENGLTGKIFEYMMLRRPVICFALPTSMMAKTLQECRIGVPFDKNQKAEAGEYFMKLYNDWRKSDYTFAPDFDEISKYNRRTLTGDLALIFDGLS